MGAPQQDVSRKQAKKNKKRRKNNKENQTTTSPKSFRDCQISWEKRNKL